VHYQPDLIRRWLLDRGSSATHHRSGGIQPAHQSMINHRPMIVPPALSSDGHAARLAKTSQGSLRLLLETADMSECPDRKVPTITWLIVGGGGGQACGVDCVERG
jgi:hypothetical protein